MLTIKQIISSGNATTSTQGALLLRAMKRCKDSKIVLNFDGLESFSTQFVNTSIGAYKMLPDAKDVQIKNCFNACYMNKIKRAAELATNKELRDFHNGLLQKLINE